MSENESIWTSSYNPNIQTLHLDLSHPITTEFKGSLLRLFNIKVTEKDLEELTK